MTLKKINDIDTSIWALFRVMEKLKLTTYNAYNKMDYWTWRDFDNRLGTLINEKA